MAKSEKSDRMRLIELQRGSSLEQLLRDFIRSGKGLDEMAEELDVSTMTVRRWLRDLGARPIRSFTFPEEPAGVS